MPARGDRFGDTLWFSGPSVEPVDSPSWQRARKAGRTAYYEELSRHLDSEWVAQTLEGRDRKNVFRRRLRSIRRGKYAGAPGKPLTPFDEDSHALRNRRWSVTDKGARLYWVGRMERRRADGTRASISIQRLMAAHGHRFGEFARGSPPRDVMGLAASRQARAVEATRKWWARRHPQDRWPTAPTPTALPTGMVARPRRRTTQPRLDLR